MAGDGELLERLRGGDEEAFTELVSRYHPSMVRLAAAYVPDRALAEEVARGAWLGVLEAARCFDGRAPVKAWLFGILIGRADGARAGRGVPAGDPAAGPGRFNATGGWAYPPQPWPEDAEQRLCAPAAQRLIRAALDDVPAGPRQVVLLRDFEGLASSGMCQLLGINEATQRVLLHRGRTRLRRALARDAGRW